MSRAKPRPTGRRLVPLVVVVAPGGITISDIDAGRPLDPSDRAIDRTYPYGTALPAATRPELLDRFVGDGLAVHVLVRVPIETPES